MPTQPQLPSHGPWVEPKPTALLVLADGTVLEGTGFGATGPQSCQQNLERGNN